MKWNDVSKKPKNGEEVLGFRTSSDWGDEYLLCTFFKKRHYYPRRLSSCGKYFRKPTFGCNIQSKRQRQKSCSRRLFLFPRSK